MSAEPEVPADPTQAFIARLVAIKYEAGRLGLYKTMHAIDEATTIVGWEVADQAKKVRT